MSALSWQSLKVFYGDRPALDLGPISLEGGQMIALLGPNGSGKSSLLKALINAVPYKATGLTLHGGPVAELSRTERARHIAYLSQARTGPALSSVRDIIKLGRVPYHGADPDGRVEAVIRRLDLSALANRRFGTLSGGEQARVLLARTLAVGADIILVDEPTAALDPFYALSLLDALKEETKRGALVIVSLHDLTLAKRYADDALILNHSRLVTAGPVSEALSPAILSDVFRLQMGEDGFQPRQ
jgi:iron complex transport system ATP-binding protein